MSILTSFVLAGRLNSRRMSSLLLIVFFVMRVVEGTSSVVVVTIVISKELSKFKLAVSSFTDKFV